MKRWIWPVLALLLSLSLGTAASETDELEIGDTSDDLQRALIRLRDLGYASEPSHGELDGFEQRNLYDFLRENRLNTQGIPEELFSGEAVPAPWTGDPEPEPAVSLHITGAPMGWFTARTLLEQEKTVRVTLCDSGIVLQFQFVDGDGYARVMPSELWDTAMIETLFPGEEAFKRRPVIVVLDGIGVGAAFSELPSENGERMFMLYFTGSSSDIAHLPDMNLDAVVRSACGQ